MRHIQPDQALIMQAMATNITVMNQLLNLITVTTTEGLHALDACEQDRAIGMMHYVGERMKQAQSLFDATLALHQTK
jgi:hypothetical protein